MKKLVFFLIQIVCFVAASPVDAQFGVRRIPMIQAAPVPPDGASTDPSPDFPLHIYVLTSFAGHRDADYHGYGSANLLQEPPRGFDYTFECATGFTPNRQNGEFYQGRWKRQDLQMEILLRPIGGGKEHTCNLKIAWKPEVFTVENATHNTSTVPSTTSAYWTPPDTALEAADPTFPLHLHVVTTRRSYYRSGPQGYGIANLLSNPPKGLEFAYECDYGFIANSQVNDFFPARWTKEPDRLEILMVRPGSTHTDKCELRVTEKDHLYPDSLGTSPPPTDLPPASMDLPPAPKPSSQPNPE